ncbi:putative disease resistance protein RGA3 [Hevea brasiliensis]|uniref:putative disease resistance protein RGA3 n=1 Tax=Hevea brasiliensis TaxID=3981 RepID=UPI00260111F6|nr:putative disease resistance protein RGA3 [Hevea brasiliensis]
MADMILSFVADATLPRVASLITDEIIHAWNLKDDLRALQDSLDSIRHVLQDAEDKQNEREHVKHVFDELTYENLRRKVEMQDQPGREPGRWDDLKIRLEKISGNNGNAIIVTTRKVETSISCRHTLDLLSDDECWSIMKEKALGNRTSIPPDSHLEAIGKEIAKKCRGVPLAAKVLGGTTGFNMNKNAWLLIVKIFPKDFEIDKEQLIQLWMAEDVEMDEYENIRSCKMHDLVHDLALSLSKSETLTLENCSTGDDISSTRHLYVDRQSAMAFSKGSAKKLCSLFIKDIVFDGSWKLKRLRTLNFGSLRHIVFSEDHHMPSVLGRLTCPQTLPLFVVGPDRGGSIQELESLNQLTGELHIKQLEEVRDKEEAKKSNLQRKTKIKALRFEWTGEREIISNDEEVLEALEPQPNIESLWIKNYLGEKFPSWLLMKRISSDGDSFIVFDNLVDLYLGGCKWCEELPRLGHLPRLKILHIYGMDKIRSIGDDFYGIDGGSTSNAVRAFPALKNFIWRVSSNGRQHQ